MDDLDEIIGYIAAEANHTDDKKLQEAPKGIRPSL